MKKLMAMCIVMTSVIASAQTESTLSIEGEVTKPLKLTVAALAKYPSTELHAKDRDGKDHTYKGTMLSVVLDSAGVTLGKDLRGENLAKFVLVKGADNYQVVYSLGEIDPELSQIQVLLATQVDGKPLPKGEGPFRLVVPGDKRPARWIREIVSVKVMFAPK